MSNLTVTSTTDTPEAIQAAAGEAVENTPAATEQGVKTAGDSGTQEEEEQQPGEENAGGEGEEESEKPAPKKGKGGFQKRIDQLVRENAELRQLAEKNTAAKP